MFERVEIQVCPSAPHCSLWSDGAADRESRADAEGDSARKPHRREIGVLTTALCHR